jgi:hypothetical protein
MCDRSPVLAAATWINSFVCNCALTAHLLVGVLQAPASAAAAAAVAAAVQQEAVARFTRSAAHLAADMAAAGEVPLPVPMFYCD